MLISRIHRRTMTRSIRFGAGQPQRSVRTPYLILGQISGATTQRIVSPKCDAYSQSHQEQRSYINIHQRRDQAMPSSAIGSLQVIVSSTHNIHLRSYRLSVTHQSRTGFAYQSQTHARFEAELVSSGHAPSISKSFFSSTPILERL